AELKAELKQELMTELKSETKASVQEATLGLRDVMKTDFADEIRAEIMQEDISGAVEEALAGSAIMGGLFKGTTVSGYLETIFTYNLRQSGEDTDHALTGGLSNADMAGWNYLGERADNSFALEAFAMFFDKEATDEHPVGWQAHLYFGEKSKRITFLGAGGFNAQGTAGGTDDTARNDIVTVAAANLTWNAPVLGKSVPITMGKMYTWIGYELVENIGNPNYSHGIIYNNAIPFTHMGMSFDVSEFMPSDKLGLQLKYVNGWDSFIDNNEAKSVGFYLTYEPTDDWFWSLATIYGNEGWNVREGSSAAQSYISTNNGGATMMYDIVVTYSLPMIDKLSLGANWDHGYIEDFKGHDGGGTGGRVPGDGIWDSTSGAHWWAFGGYAMYDWADNQMGALRYEYMDDTDTARTFGYSIWDLTYTHNITVGDNLMLRPEVRYIKHNVPDGEQIHHGKAENDLRNDNEMILTFGAEYVF
ncbi:MAG: outer membrane beta-barrel protein, partial [Anaerolineales bacterium]|nr:outer membrane beta-barrel protein [Anaerolineales bacterium]